MSDEINSHPSKKNSWSIGKHLMMATLTGGLSLIFVLGLRLPALWESVCLVHAEWIQKGRDPRIWRWIGLGWLATGSTLLVILPAAMILTVMMSCMFPGTFFRHTASVHLSPVLLLTILIPFSTIALALAVILTWTWHTLRQSLALFWATAKQR